MRTKKNKALRWVAFETIPAGVDRAWLVEYKPKAGSRLGQIELTSAGHKGPGHGPRSTLMSTICTGSVGGRTSKPTNVCIDTPSLCCAPTSIRRLCTESMRRDESATDQGRIYPHDSEKSWG